MTNTNFPNLTLTSTAFEVPLPKPAITMSTTTPVGNSFSFDISANADNTPIQVDWGDGTTTNYTIGSGSTTITGTLTDNTVSIYGIGITYFAAYNNNNLTSLDVSNCSMLEWLDCQTNSLTQLNLTNNTGLEVLTCLNNQISTLDLSKNTNLIYLHCENNQLSQLDLTNNTSLQSVYCYGNMFNYSSLPLPAWTAYSYSPQAPLKLAKTEYALNEEVDLSSQLTAGGNTTVYTWKTVSGDTLVKNVDYTENSGKFTFLKQPCDYFYCEMTNATFPELTLKTENIFITQTEPSITMTTTTPVDSLYSFYIAANADNTPIQVDWGDGVKSNYNIESTWTRITGILSNDTIKVYGLGIVWLQIESINLTNIDVSKAMALKWLDCYSNLLINLDVSNNTNLQILNCSDNQLASIDIANNSLLQQLVCSFNDLTSIDISKNTNLFALTCNNNEISTFNFSNNTALNQINISNNRLTFNTLPINQLSWLTFTYSPQALLKLAKTEYALNKEVDLSSQLTAGGNTTVYTWKTAGGNTLAKDVDYMELNGKFYFQKSYSDSIYCEMTNATFPDLTLETSKIVITVTSPSVSMATIKTIGNNFGFNINAASDNTPLLVDWGDGSITNYTIGKSTTSISGTLAGDTVKFWAPGVEYLDVSYLKLTVLDVSNTPTLKNLSCDMDDISELDLSKNDSLYNLSCPTNQLTSLILPNTGKLKYISCQYNYLTFANLPLVNPNWFYSYSPQEAMKMGKSEYGIGEVIDLSNQLNINGNVTSYTWVAESGNTLVKDVDYMENNGKFTFVAEQTESVYCQMTNDEFPDLTLETDHIWITLSSPNVAFATTQTLGSELSFNVSSNEDNSCIIVDWGDGSITKYTYGKSNTSITGTLAGDTVRIYGSGISLLDAGSKNLTYLYVSGAQYLQILICNSNQIDTLDVTNNSNLQYLDFRVNKLKYIDLSKNNVLETFLGNANMLTGLNLANNTSLKTLDCQSNQISSLNLSSNDSLQTLWCSYNNLSELNISNDTLLKLLYCSGNKISTLDVSNNLALSELRCENNNLTFVSLPLKEASWITYSYTPQNNVILPKKQYGLTETVDLSSELTVNGNTTNFAWKTKGGTALTVGTDYTVTGGVTTFLKVQTDSVYCEMTNATFPYLTLKTCNILISQFPLSVPDNEVLFKVYPNPAFNYLNIELPEKIVRVEIFNETGVKVYEHNFNTNKVTVPTSNIPKGMLIVKVYTKKEVYNGKVMKL